MTWGSIRRRSFRRVALTCASALALGMAGRACAADADAPTGAVGGSTAAIGAVPDAVGEIRQPSAASAAPAPAPDFGESFLERFVNCQLWEVGETGPPGDPNGPPSRRPDFPPQPETTPPMPFTEWPHGATTPIGVTRPGSVDSPLMAALQPSALGKAGLAGL